MTLEVREITPRGPGAVSVVRLRGPAALSTAAQLARRPLASGDVAVARLRVAGETLDEALVLARAADDVELHVHGSPVVVRALVAHLSQLGEGAGPRFASAASVDASPRSESTRQLSLRERALALLAHAACAAAARILLDQAEGAFERELEALARVRGLDRSHRLSALVERGRVARFALEPALVVLAGPPNAGKSTLFNLLAGERRALVADHPGTTRDLVRASAHLGAYPIELVDTAGDRDASSDPLERAGIERARQQRAGAAWILWLSRGDSQGELAPSLENLSRVRSCADADALRTGAAISALHAPAAARATLEGMFLARFGLPRAPWSRGTAVQIGRASL